MRPPRIFLVQEDAVAGRALADHLRHFGYDVCGNVQSVEHAARDLPVAQPDLVVADRDLGGLCDLPVLLLGVEPFQLETLRANIAMALRLASDRARLVSELLHRDELSTELNHRVKNNLQTIMGLLRLECGDFPDVELQGKLSRILDRIQAIAMVHEQLSIAEATDVDVAHFLRRLAGSVLETYGREHAIRFDLEERAPLVLSPGVLMTVGMMVSELLVNAARHAFPDGRKGRLGLRVDGSAARPQIIVEDDGVGLPKVLDLSRSLGLRLIRSFATRLDADLDFETPPTSGTRVVLTLPTEAPSLTS